MSKVLHLLDWNDLLSYRHEKWIVAEMKEQEKLDYENITDDDKFESYVNPDGDFTSDDIPF